MVKLLHEHGAKLDVKDKKGRTLFQVARSNGRMDVVKYLLDQSKDTLADERRKLLISGGINNKADALEWIRLGGDIHARNEEGETPLHRADEGEVAALLISKGAKIDARDNEGGTPLHNAANEGWTETARVLIEHRADVNARD